MNDTITPLHVLLMWNLLFTGDEPKLSEAKPGFTRKKLEPLTDAGLIQLEKRGRSTHLVLTERAWRWCSENLDQPFSPRGNATPALAALLPKLKAYVDRTGTPLAELLADADAPAPPPPEQPPNIDEAIRAAYLKLSGGQWETRVRLANLREHLSAFSRASQDEALVRMQYEGRLVLYKLDDPQDTYEEDRHAALLLGGNPRHLVYMKG